MKVREVKESYWKVESAIYELQQKAFKAYMDKEDEDDNAERIRYAAISKVYIMVYNRWLDMCVKYSKDFEAEADHTYMEELENAMNLVSTWTAKADSEAGKLAFGECLKVLTGAWLLEKMKTSKKRKEM